MPTLIMENVPPDLYERLQQRATAHQRTLPEETLYLLQQVLRAENCPIPRLPEFIQSEEVSAPYDLPRLSQPVLIVACSGQPRLPDPPPDGERE
jgi:plasmid stability protein